MSWIRGYRHQCKEFQTVEKAVWNHILALHASGSVRSPLLPLHPSPCTTCCRQGASSSGANGVKKPRDPRLKGSSGGTARLPNRWHVHMRVPSPGGVGGGEMCGREGRNRVDRGSSSRQGVLGGLAVGREGEEPRQFRESVAGAHSDDNDDNTPAAQAPHLPGRAQSRGSVRARRARWPRAPPPPPPAGSAPRSSRPLRADTAARCPPPPPTPPPRPGGLSLRGRLAAAGGLCHWPHPPAAAAAAASPASAHPPPRPTWRARRTPPGHGSGTSGER